MSLGLIFTYGMTYGGSAVALVNPYVGFLIYVAFAILRPGPGLWYWSVPEGNYSRIVALSLVVGWVARGGGDWRLGRAWAVVLCPVAYLVWNLLAAAQVQLPAVAWEWIEGQAKVILPCVIGITLLDSVRKLKQLAWLILVCHGYVAYDLNMSYFSGFNRLQEIGFGGVDNNCMGIALVTCIGLGIFLGLGTPGVWQKATAGLCIAFMVHAVLFSFSRGAMLGLILVVGLSFVLIPKRAVHYAVLGGGVLVSVYFTGPQVAERFMSSFGGEGKRDESAESRIELWTTCLKVTARHPLTGLGPHHFPVHAHEYGFTVGKEAHTTWLQLAAEIGVPGASFLLAYYLLAIARLWPLTRESYPVPDPWLRHIARMVVAATAGFLFTAQFVTLPGLEAPYFVALLGAGALKLASVPAPGPGEEPAAPAAEGEPS